MSASINVCVWYHCMQDGKAHAYISERHDEYWGNFYHWGDRYLCGKRAPLEPFAALTDVCWGTMSPPPGGQDICEACLIEYVRRTL